jgi:hypothetical protein
MGYSAYKATDGSTITAYWQGKKIYCTKIGAKDGLAKSAVNVLGEQETRAFTYGKYNVEASDIEMLHQDFYDPTEGLLSVLPANGYGNVSGQIVVRSEDFDTNPVTAQSPALLELLDVTITGVTDAYENSEGQTVVTVQVQPRQILRNGKSINRRRGVPAI